MTELVRIVFRQQALLGLNEPTKVIARTKRPVLEPKDPCEKNGDVNNMVFPTAAYVMDGKLFVYYGAADKDTVLPH